jgi:hypothetical protein
MDGNPRFDSEVYKDFLFKEPVAPSNKSISINALRNDTLELRLYQVCTVPYQECLRN